MLKKSQLLFALVLALVAILSVSTPSALAKTNDKPGWGFGDHNHHHTGPPGHSVRPDGDNDFDDHIARDEHRINNNPHISSSDKASFINALEDAFNKFKHFFG